MANGHAKAFSAIEGCEVVACADIVAGRAEEFAGRHSIASAYQDVEEMLSQEDLDAVSVVTPDQHHMPPVLMAIEHGLHVMCEKPLASTLDDAKKMAEAAKAKGVLTCVNFSYRNNAGTQKAAEMVASGQIGRVIHVEGAYLQSWLASKIWGDWRAADMFQWRMSTRHGSLGVLGDVGVHLYDFVSFIAGDIDEIFCDLRTFDKDINQIGDYVFDANESMVANLRFTSGAIGTLHSSRWATGRANSVSTCVYGDKGAIDLNLDRPAPETLKACLGENVDKAAWENIECEPTPNMYQRFVQSVLEHKQGQTSFEGGVKIQSYLDASVRSSEAGTYVKTGVA